MSITWDKMEPGLYYEVTKGSTDGTFKTGDVVRKFEKGIEAIKMDCCEGLGWYPNILLEDEKKMADFQAILWDWEYGKNFLLSLLSDADCDIIELQHVATKCKQVAMERILHTMSSRNIRYGVEMMRISRWLNELIFMRLNKEYK